MAERTDIMESMKQLKVTVDGIEQPDDVHWEKTLKQSASEKMPLSRDAELNSV